MSPAHLARAAALVCLSTSAATAFTGGNFGARAGARGIGAQSGTRAAWSLGTTSTRHIEEPETAVRTAVGPDGDASSFGCDVVYEGDVAARGPGKLKCFDEGITPEVARAIVSEAAAKMTVPKATLVDALHCLAQSTLLSLKAGLNDPLPVEALGGFWKLRFCSGPACAQLGVDTHGYVTSTNELMALSLLAESQSLLFDAKFGEQVGQEPPAGAEGTTMQYSPGTQSLFSTGSELGAMGPVVMRQGGEEEVAVAEHAIHHLRDLARVPLQMHACLVDKTALALSGVLQGQDAFMLFQREAGQPMAGAAAAANNVVPLRGKGASRQPRATKGLTKAGADADLTIGDEIKAEQARKGHDMKRAMVTEEGRREGSLDNFMRYLEEEGLYIYAILAGPTLLNFFQRYLPIGTWKATHAMLVLSDVVQSVFERSA